MTMTEKQSSEAHKLADGSLNSSIERIHSLTAPQTAIDFNKLGVERSSSAVAPFAYAESKPNASAKGIVSDFFAMAAPGLSKQTLPESEHAPYAESGAQQSGNVSAFNVKSPESIEMDNQFNPSMKKKSLSKMMPSSEVSTSKDKIACEEFLSPKDGVASQRSAGGTRRKGKQTDKKDAKLTKAIGILSPDSAREGPLTTVKKEKASISAATVSDHTEIAIEDRADQLPIMGRRSSQMSVTSPEARSTDTRRLDQGYLMSLQSFRFCLRSLPLIK